ncbi:hypothetical protein DNH61_09030 [Paenibacillus sambharensis]|uniref:Uncharacterized protein YyaB-like PH domain-containing protein n=1 Tax=Paenibacillus sambharensis TaxID=1803190 RepID=A0A2W1LW90_9BACL|nr:PH domain-containing protein [Paenibacillus sambharensis]PZD96051.1 hypothetical protein DNH61_09030 [Paenibacillus sambharensis]
MRFQVKRDIRYIVGGLLCVAVIDLVLVLPHWMNKGSSLTENLWFLLLAFAISWLVMWLFFDISYKMEDDALVISAGPFRSRIPYENITKISKAKEIQAGYRPLLASDALEIHYCSGVFSSVKLSPRDKQRFLEELIKRCPSLIIGPLV